MSLSHSKSFIVFACAGLILGVVVWASGRMTRKQTSAQEIDVRIHNATDALKVISAKKVGDGDVAILKVTVMNQSHKIVFAYSLSSGEGGMTSFGLSLAPGDYNTERIPFANLEPSVEDKSVRDLRLSAVYLEDGSSEGENISVKRLNNRMLGMQEQAAIAVDALRKASASDESDPARLVKMIEDNISSTPILEHETEIASERLAGRAFIKEKISRELKNLGDSKIATRVKIQARLGGLVVSVEKLSGTTHVKK